MLAREVAQTCRVVANMARWCAHHPNSAETNQLASKMCWDSVLHLLVLAEVIEDDDYKRIDRDSIVNPNDPAIANAQAMRNLPAGRLLGFFDGTRMIHTMVSLGGGEAAGNKNDCIGAGAPVGWQVLNLARDLAWNGAGIDAPRGVLKRSAGNEKTIPVTVRHRPIWNLEAGMGG
jgi:hypothetical protein